MSNFTIISDSSCDLSEDLIKEYNLNIVPFYVSFDKENYRKEKIDISIKEFYEKMENEKAVPKTSLPSVEDYYTAFTPHLKNGQDILCFSLSSELSGSYQSAFNASKLALQDFPERKVICIDSRKAAALQGLYVLQSAKMRKEGFTIDETYNKMMEISDESLIIFTINTLEYLQKGGRVGKAAALASSILNIKPILLLKDGALEPHSKVRGRKKSISELLNIFNKEIGNNPEKYEIAIAHSNCKEEAEELEKSLKEKSNVELSYPIFEIGVTVGAHTGTKAVGIAYMKKYNA